MDNFIISKDDDNPDIEAWFDGRRHDVQVFADGQIKILLDDEAIKLRAYEVNNEPENDWHRITILYNINNDDDYAEMQGWSVKS